MKTDTKKKSIVIHCFKPEVCVVSPSTSHNRLKIYELFIVNCRLKIVRVTRFQSSINIVRTNTQTPHRTSDLNATDLFNTNAFDLAFNVDTKYAKQTKNTI